MNHEFQFVTLIHGNESMPHQALKYMQEPHVVANPLAQFLRKRYIHRDLNASFGVSGILYEQLRAPQVLRQLDGQRSVIDFHTFSCDSPPFVIVVDPAMLPLAASLGVEYVVYMKFTTKAGHALLHYRRGVSIEVGNHIDQNALALTEQIVKRLIIDGINPRPVQVFEVLGKIEKPGNYTNFVQSEDNFFPVLYGEKAYLRDGFYGLKALSRGVLYF